MNLSTDVGMPLFLFINAIVVALGFFTDPILADIVRKEDSFDGSFELVNKGRMSSVIHKVNGNFTLEYCLPLFRSFFFRFQCFSESDEEDIG